MSPDIDTKSPQVRQDLCGIVVGGEDGIIRVYRMSPDIDTKSPQVY